MGQKRDNSKKRLAEQAGAYVTATLMDAEDEMLRVEFAGLDLTEEENADLVKAWSLRRRGAPSADLRASRAMFDQVRRSLAEALQVTIRHEAREADLVAALAKFDADEATARERLNRQKRYASNAEAVAVVQGKLDTLVATARFRRQEVADAVSVGGRVTPLAKTDALRIHSRDGLADLYERKRLTTPQFNCASTYRHRYEAASGDLRSSLGSSSGRSLTPMQVAHARAQAAEWDRQRIKVELAIVRRLHAEEFDALRLMRRVAGEGHSLTSEVGSGRRRDAGLRVLVKSLDLIGQVFPHWR